MKRSSAICAVVAVAVTLPLSAADAPDGAAVFKSKCAMCHGADGAGQTPTGKSMRVRDLRSEEVQKLKDEELETIIAKGKGKMPAYENKIDEETIDALVRHIRELAKKK